MKSQNINKLRPLAPEIWEALVHELKGDFQAVLLRHGILLVMYVHENPIILSLADVKKLPKPEAIHLLMSTDVYFHVVN